WYPTTLPGRGGKDCPGRQGRVAHEFSRRYRRSWARKDCGQTTIRKRVATDAWFAPSAPSAASQLDAPTAVQICGTSLGSSWITALRRRNGDRSRDLVAQYHAGRRYA